MEVPRDQQQNVAVRMRRGMVLCKKIAISRAAMRRRRSDMKVREHDDIRHQNDTFWTNNQRLLVYTTSWRKWEEAMLSSLLTVLWSAGPGCFATFGKKRISIYRISLSEDDSNKEHRQ